MSGNDKGPTPFDKCENPRCKKKRCNHTPDEVKECRKQKYLDSGESAGSRHTKR